MLERHSIRQQVRDGLIERITAGLYAPGDRLLELQLAEEFGVSQAPVREALRELETMRLVESTPYRGTRVRKFDRKDLADSYAVRAVLEQLAGELSGRHAPSHWDVAGELARTIDAAAERDNLREYAQADVKFHRFIVESSNNTTLLEQWDSLAMAARISTVLHIRVLPVRKTAADHTRIGEALRAQDGPAAGRLLRAHCDFVREILLSSATG